MLNAFFAVAAFLTSLALAAPARAQQPPILLEGERVFPESLDVARDGTIYVGSIGKGGIYRVAPGATKASIWIDKAAGKLSAPLGVVVDEAGGKLWVCSSDINRIGEPVSLKSFNLQTGANIADYPFPENKGLCNDIAIKDGVVYATDTPNSRIFRLKAAATALELWTSDPRFEGIDGLAFGKDGQLYVNNVRQNNFFRIEVKADASAGAITPLKTSRPVEGPDSIRATADGRFVITENRGGRVGVATVQDDTLVIENVREGLDFPPGAAVGGDMIYAIEGKFRFRNDPLKNADAGAFMVIPIPLPKAK